MIDIDSLRGLDAHRAADAELAARLAEIDSEAAGKVFSSEQKTEFEATVEQRETLAPMIRELEIRQAALTAALGAGGRNTETPGVLNMPTVIKAPENVFDLSAYRQRVSSIEDLPRAYREGAMRVLDQAHFPTAPDQAKAKGQVEKLIEKHRDESNGWISRHVIGTSDPAYQDAWANHIARRPLTARMQAALQTYSDTDGGSAIPVVIDPTFINTSDGSVNPMRRLARVETITVKSWTAITTAGVSAAYVGERTTTGAADSAPSDIDDPTITPLRADVAIDLTAEYRADYGATAIAGEVGTLIQAAKDDLEADAFVMGAGTTEPDGVVTALITDTTSVVTTITNDVFALADIDKLIGQLPPRFRSKAKADFLANLAILQLIPAFGSAGQPGNSIYDALSGTLRGYRVSESSAMDDVATDAKEILLLGDFKAGFVIVDRLGLTTQVLDGRDTNGRPTGNTVIYASWRNSSGLLFPNAFRLLKVA